MGICEWVQSDDGVYETDCHKQFEFYTDGPEGNGFEYCPYCGRRIVEVVEHNGITLPVHSRDWGEDES